jgi:hypothetical protein
MANVPSVVRIQAQEQVVERLEQQQEKEEQQRSHVGVAGAAGATTTTATITVTPPVKSLFPLTTEQALQREKQEQQRAQQGQGQGSEQPSHAKMSRELLGALFQRYGAVGMLACAKGTVR